MPANQRSEGDRSCFHCGLPVPPGTDITVEFQGRLEPMCCHGCQAVAQAIIDGGMERFYTYRTEKTGKAREVVPEFLQQIRTYDNPVVQKQFVHDLGNVREVSLILEGIVCAACVWLNEQHLRSLPGVVDVGINYSNHRAHVVWDDHKIRLSEILEAVSRIGYLAHPYDPDRQQAIIEKQRRAQLRSIGLSGVLGMQVMILAVALYTGDWWGIEESFYQFFRWTSLLVTVPIVLFSSRVFFESAWRDLRNARAGMDVPVSLGIGIAFVTSTVNTAAGSGEIYFDSVAMFTFFLLTARYFEMTARKRASEATESMVSLQPAVAARLRVEHGVEREEAVPVAELVEGDRVLVRPGDTLPADGIVERGCSSVNESLITGESLPQTREVNDEVIGGSINTENPLVVRVTRIGADSVLASIQRLLDKAQSEKPRISMLADRIASRFVVAILTIAALVAGYWWLKGSPDWIAITVATLIVTCPCALSLATPTAVTAASGRMAQLGLLTTRGHALETLSRATHFVFDKTGTLTFGRIRLAGVRATGARDEKQCLQLAAALESESEHPIAKAFLDAVDAVAERASDIENTPGSGVSGTVAGTRWHLGNADYIQKNSGASLPAKLHTQAGTASVLLANDRDVAALFTLADEVRPEAGSVIHSLRKAGLSIVLLSGDNRDAVERIAQELGIEQAHAGLKPEGKLAHIHELQQNGAVVCMTGDGINDAPVLAGADVSIAMGSGSQIAAASADLILLSSNLQSIHRGYHIALKTIRIIRENLGWAIGYNLIAIPLAAAGYIQPWLAAIGMSASSLIVVLNALRLSKRQSASGEGRVARAEENIANTGH